jgi:TRAP-type mannitol/chloroaromatic compound transport system permease small subunit
MKWSEGVVGKIAQMSSLLLITMVILLVFDVFSRYLFQSGSIMLQELEWHLFATLFLLALVVTQRHDENVRVDILYANFSPKRKALINVLSSLLIILPFSLTIIYYGIDFTLMSYNQLEGSSNPGGIPYRFIIKSVMVVAFILVLVQTLSDVVKYYQRYKES